MLMSCNAITKNVEQKFIEMNNGQLDTIGIISNLNDSLYSLLDTAIYMNSDVVEYEKINLKFKKFYSIIDSIHFALIKGAHNTGDIEIVNSVMITGKGEQRLQNETRILRKMIAPNIHTLQFGELYYKSIDKHVYVTRNGFNHIPLFSAIPLLNKWKSDKLKEQNLILKKVIDIPKEKNPQNLKIGDRVKHMKYGIGELIELSNKYVGTFKFQEEERRIILKFTKFEIEE